MDQDIAGSVDLFGDEDLNEILDVGDGSWLPPIEIEEPEHGGGGGGSGRPAEPEAGPWFTPVLLGALGLFGALQLLILWMGNTGGIWMAWALGLLFGVAYLGFFHLGAHWIRMHR